jgi:hypothetical protein
MEQAGSGGTGYQPVFGGNLAPNFGRTSSFYIF